MYLPLARDKHSHLVKGTDADTLADVHYDVVDIMFLLYVDRPSLQLLASYGLM